MKSNHIITKLVLSTIVSSSIILTIGARADVRGWLNWRGPAQTGVSLETGLPDVVEPGKKNNLWEISLAGGGTPVIANGKLFALGYRGAGPDLQEVLLCANADTGKVLWEKTYNDYMSDITYDRYAIGSPCIDSETGNVYVMTSAGVFSCYKPDGKVVFQHYMMEELGRLTFTNGRTGGPFIENDLVIVRGITSNWGGEGAAQDRMYAYDKKTGLLVWSCSPGVAPKDNSFAKPWQAWRNGKRVLYTGSGDGSILCVNARTGETMWRYPISAGGLNASVVVHNGNAIAVHADENLDSSEVGRMVAVKVNSEGKKIDPALPPQLDRTSEAWRNELASISSSPVLVGDRIYEVIKTGVLCCIDANTGVIIWRYKLGPDQLHASPIYAEGKLFIPIQNGMFFILKPGDKDCQELCKVQLEGRAIGAPAIWNGKLYVHTTAKLYCFGLRGAKGYNAKWPVENLPKPGATVALQIIPSEVLLHPGSHAKFTVRGIDANGFPTQLFDPAKCKWAKYIPPTAKVRAELNASVDARGELVADPQSGPSAGAFQATIDGFSGVTRGRILPALPLKIDFTSFKTTESLPAAPDEKFAYPPLPWIGARFKFDVRTVDDRQVLAKTLDNIFFQRGTVFFGHPDETNYTLEADVRVDGNRRTKSSVGLINQRYLVSLEGNAQEVMVTSNQERIRVAVPFTLLAKEWYHLLTRVDVAADGSGFVRAKVWKKGDSEPSKWTIEVPHKHAHAAGSPGLYGFAPQSLFKVYVDNISVTPNK